MRDNYLLGTKCDFNLLDGFRETFFLQMNTDLHRNHDNSSADNVKQG